MRRKYVPPRTQHVNSYAETGAETGDSSEHDVAHEPFRMRFGTRELLIFMVISSVLFAGFGYLFRALRGGGRGSHLVFILFTLVGPMALLIVFSLASWLIRIPDRRPRTDNELDDEREDVG